MEKDTHLNQYGLGLEIKITYDELLVELEMSQEKYISAVRTSLVRPKLFLKCRLFCTPSLAHSPGSGRKGIRPERRGRNDCTSLLGGDGGSWFKKPWKLCEMCRFL